MFMWKDIMLVIYLTILGIMDIKECKLPVWLLWIGGMFALGMGLLERLCLGRGLLNTLIEILSGMLPGSILLLVAFLTKKAGYGDGIVLLQLGFIYSYALVWAFLCISLLLLSVIAMIFLALKKIQKDTAVPYIPFLTVTFTGYVFMSG